MYICLYIHIYIYIYHSVFYPHRVLRELPADLNSST